MNIRAPGLILLSVGMLARAQSPLSLPEAVQTALHHHPSLEAATERKAAATARIDQAASALLPQLSYRESVMRGNHPVYAFGTLLSQRRFTEANFDIHSLNRPAWLNNFQSQVRLDQMIWDFGATRSAVRSSEAAEQMTEQQRQLVQRQLLVQVARAYHAVSLAAQSLQVAQESLKAAEEDERQATARRAAGMATDADMLATRVRVAEMKEDVVRRRSDLEIAQGVLNQTLGLDLETPHQLTTALTPVIIGPAPDGPAPLQSRPELQMLDRQRDAVELQAKSAHARLLPVITAQGVFEADRQTFATRGGGNWQFSMSMNWNLFDGNRTRAVEREAAATARSIAAERKEMLQSVSLELRKARLQWESAQERLTASAAAVGQAEEALRIVRNRYANGLANISEVLHAEREWNAARLRTLQSTYEQRMAAVEVEYARGTLNGDSDVLR